MRRVREYWLLDNYCSHTVLVHIVKTSICICIPSKYPDNKPSAPAVVELARSVCLPLPDGVKGDMNTNLVSSGLVLRMFLSFH